MNLGPGEYDYNLKFNRDLSKSVFKSSTNRFDYNYNQTPGPGSYITIDEKDSKKINKKSPIKDPIKWTRIPTAPTIPSSIQKYGYEEGRPGELIVLVKIFNSL